MSFVALPTDPSLPQAALMTFQMANAWSGYFFVKARNTVARIHPLSDLPLNNYCNRRCKSPINWCASCFMEISLKCFFLASQEFYLLRDRVRSDRGIDMCLCRKTPIFLNVAYIIFIWALNLLRNRRSFHKNDYIYFKHFTKYAYFRCLKKLFNVLILRIFFVEVFYAPVYAGEGINSKYDKFQISERNLRYFSVLLFLVLNAVWHRSRISEYLPLLVLNPEYCLFRILPMCIFTRFECIVSVKKLLFYVVNAQSFGRVFILKL